MSSHTTSEPLTYDAIRRSLGRKFNTFDVYKTVKEWDSGHAHFTHFTLTRSRPKAKDSPSHDFVGKQYQTTQTSDDPLYAICHSPDLLFAREKRNLELIIDTVGTRFSRKHARTLVPEVYGASAQDHLLNMGYLAGDNQKKVLLTLDKAVAETIDPNTQGRYHQFSQEFLRGVISMARFVGSCNAAGDLLKQRWDFERDQQTTARVQNELFLKTLLRLAYASNEGFRTYAQQQGALDNPIEAARDYATTLLSNPLLGKLQTIRDARRSFRLEDKFQHGDCSGLNQIGSTMLDLEDFGLDDPCSDPGSYHTLLGLVGSSILHSADFPYTIQAYLAVEHAFETQDEEGMKELPTATNGKFGKYIQKWIEQADYERFILGVFGQMIDKLVYLGGGISRHDRPELVYGANVGIDNIRASIEDVFRTVSQLDSFAILDKNESSARHAFAEYAKVLNTLGITEIETPVLMALEGSSTAIRLRQADPYSSQR